MIKCGSFGSLQRSVVHSSRTTVPHETKNCPFKDRPETVPLKHLGQHSCCFSSILNTLLHSILYLQYLHLEQRGMLTPCALSPQTDSLLYKNMWHGSMVSISLNREEEFLLQLSGPVLYLSSRSLFDAILSLSQSIISGLPQLQGDIPRIPFLEGWGS